MSVEKKYLHNIDLVNNKLINPILNPLTTAQRTAVGTLLTTLDQGYVCFDTTENVQYFWNGINWVTVTAVTSWGNITGTITNQFDLIAYLSANYYPLSTNPAGYLTTSSASAIYVPLTRNLTINGITHNLSTDQSWTIDALPSQLGQSGKYLTTNGSVASWATISLPTGAALTKVNDTNVTLTLGGTPNTALLQGVSLTLGWTGTLDDSRITSANTWNAKQAALLGTGIVKSTSGTISYISGSGTQFVKGDGSLDSSTYLTSAVTSVGLSMPTAFTVANSPVTSTGTLTVTGAGVASQYIRGDGTLANFPTSSGGGSSVNYYLNASVSQGTIGGNPYRQLSKNPVTTLPGTDIPINIDGVIARFITDAGDPALLSIPGGSWDLQFYFSASSAGGSPSFYANIYKYNGSTFTLLGSSSTVPESITGGTTTDKYSTSVSISTTSILVTDRIAIEIYVNHSGRTITLHTEGANLCKVTTTFVAGIVSINGITDQIQYFQVGTSGTDFNIDSSSISDVHIFNIPVASGTNTGKLSSTDWTTFNSKEPSITAGTTSQYWRGDKTWQTFPTIPTVGTWGALNYPTWTSGTPFVKMTAAGTFSLDSNTYLTTIAGLNVSSLLNDSGYITSSALSPYLTSSLASTTYVPLTRTLSINGTLYDLSANRSWTVGDVLTSGSYSDPLWITSLAWSKISGAPSFLTAAITSLGGLIGATQTFGNDTNITMVSSGTTHTLTWNGTLADNRIASANAWNAKIDGSGTTNQIAYFTGSGTIGSLSTGTYPSLTELSYVKGVTSDIQTQINSKQGNLTLTTLGSTGVATLVGNTLNVPQYIAPSSNLFNYYNFI